MSVDTAYRVGPLHRGDPERLGRYRLTGRLGSGGMGVVYLALDRDGGYVAIKLVHASLAYSPEFRLRFRSEVERARQVPSFCTAEVLDADLDHNPPYLVVEYVDGPSLAEVVEDRGPLKAAHLHSVAVGVATALTGIHSAGVIHRDLKPENVLLAPGSPKVIDFGIARAFEATSQFTRADQMVGTVAYMAPERFSSRPGTDLTAAADIFAWGCVIGYAGTGQTPFHGDSPPATAARILTQPPHLAGMAEPLRGLVELALAKDPEDRPSARELLDMLLGHREIPRYGPSGGGLPDGGTYVDRAELLQPAYDYDEHPLRPVRAHPAQSGRARSSARWLAVLAVLLVIAGIGTVAAVLGVGGRFGDALVSGAQRGNGGSAAGSTDESAPRSPAASSKPAAAPTRTPTPSEPTGGETIIQGALRVPGLWLDSEIREQGANCFTRGVMQVGRVSLGDYRCVGSDDVDEVIADDFGVEVTTSLRNADSCAAIWFHWTFSRGGHVLRLCSDSLSVAADTVNDQRIFGTVQLAKPIPLQKSTRVHLVVRDSRAEVFRDGKFIGSVDIPPGEPDQGQVLLGISVTGRTGPPPYQVTFANLDIRSL